MSRQLPFHSRRQTLVKYQLLIVYANEFLIRESKDTNYLCNAIKEKHPQEDVEFKKNI